MHRKSDSALGNLKKTLKTVNVYQKPSTTNKQHTKQKKHYRYQQVSNSKIPKLENSKIPKFQDSKNLKNPKLFTSTESCMFFGFWIFGFWDFGIFGFLEFSQSLPNNCSGQMGKVSIFACRRGGEHICIYICMCVYICHTYIHKYRYTHICTHKYQRC